MRQTTHSTQVVSPFGSGYVHEDHRRGQPQQEPRARSGAVLAVVLTVVLFSVATAAAITASSRDCSTAPVQGGNLPSILGKLPGSIGFGEALY